MADLKASQGVRLSWNGPQIEKAIREAARAELKATLEYGVFLAKQVVPVDTGELRDSIKATKLVGNQYGVKGEIEATAGHALYVELGTVKMRAQPYLRPAADVAFRNFPKKLAARVQNIGGF